MHSYRDELCERRIDERSTLSLESLEEALLVPCEDLTDEWMIGCVGLEVDWEFLFFVEEDLIEKLLFHIVLRYREVDLEREQYHRTDTWVHESGR